MKAKKISHIKLNLIFLLKIFTLPKFKVFSLILFTLLVSSSLTPVFTIELTKRLLNAIQLNENIELVLLILSFMVILQAAQRLNNILNDYLSSLFQLKLSNHVTEMIMDQIDKIENEELFSSKTIDLLYFLRATSTDKLASIFHLSISFISTLITFISLFLYLIYSIPLLAVLVVLASIPIAIVQLYFNKKNFALTKDMNKHERKRFYLLFISTTPQYLKEIIQNRSIPYLVKSNQKIFKTIYNPSKNLLKKAAIAVTFTSFLSIIAIGIAQYNTILLVFEGQILIGTFMSIIQSLGMVSQRINGLIMTLGGFHSDWLYINNLREFFKKDSDVQENIAKTSISLPISISAKNLSYSIEGQDVFNNLNFNFQEGSIIGITGANGAGKSSLLEIIQGIRKESNGTLYFNNKASNTFQDYQRADISQTFFQYPARYEFTLGENIGISDIKNYVNNKTEIMKHIAEIDPDSFLLESSITEETLLGEWFEESHQLSGGQWQKIALYRLLFKKSPIYLIDEPTNNLDKNSLKLLENIIRKVSPQSLIIIVSHDIEFLSNNCTDIYLLEKNGLNVLNQELIYTP